MEDRVLDFLGFTRHDQLGVVGLQSHRQCPCNVHKSGSETGRRFSGKTTATPRSRTPPRQHEIAHGEVNSRFSGEDWLDDSASFIVGSLHGIIRVLPLQIASTAPTREQVR